MIERTFDADFFNRICNDPDVRPTLWPGDDPIDCSALIANPINYALRTEHGGFILTACGAGYYSVHTQFAVEGRGSHAVEAMRDGLDYMFTRTDCLRIHSHCPDNNPSALRLAQAGGARPWFRSELSPLGPSTVVQWDIMDWTANNEALEDAGREFHDATERALYQADIDVPDHPQDKAHDRFVGASVLMCKRGKVAKGVLQYNLWALAAGYTPIRMVSADPPVIDCSEPGQIEMTMGLDRRGNLEVLTCQSV